MSYQNEAWIMGATVITLGTLGASVFPTKITSPPGAVGGQYKLLTAAGSTVVILPNAIIGTTISTLSALSATIAGYPINAAGVENSLYTGPANFYLAATGATATIAFNFRFSAGATLG